MEHQFRRGIYRPNAQRLSISLGPLVLHRSLLFRVETDLATEASYTELTPTEESPYCLSENSQIATAVFTAISVTISTAMSSASVYSQDSWKTSTESPFVCLVKVNPRRMAIAFSPSVQWSDIVDMAEGCSDKEPTVKTPLVSSPSSPFILQPDVSFSEVREDNDITTHPEPDVVPTLASDADRKSVGSLLDAGLPSLVEKMHTKIRSKSKKIIDEQPSPKRSRSSKAFRKVMAHLTPQPSKREIAQIQRADIVATSNKFLSTDFKLPEFRVSPIRYSFIAQSNIYPSILPKSNSPSFMAPSFDTLVEDGEDAVGVRQLCATMPPPVTSPEMKVRRRFQSSSEVSSFPWVG